MHGRPEPGLGYKAHHRVQSNLMWQTPGAVCIVCCLLFIGTLANGQSCLASNGDASIAVNSFGLALFQCIKNATGEANTVFSPLSVSTVASYVSLFANGTTKAEVDEVFRFDSEGTIPRTLIAQPWDTGSTVGEETGNLAIVNGLFLQEDLEVENRIVDSAGDAVKKVDFSNSEGTRQSINSWAEDSTGGLIEELLPVGSLDAQTKFVLASAVFFQSNWEQTFEPSATKQQPFHGQYGVEDAMFMYQFDRTLLWKWDPVAGQALELPYEGGLFSMYIVLPDTGNSVAAVAEVMSRGNFGQWLTEGYSQTLFTTVVIPKFEIELSLDLTTALHKLGVKDAFDALKADFTPITKDVPLHIDSAVHKARIVVNETGTKAAGVAAIAVQALSAQMEPVQHFVADRPFLYFIVDKLDCIVLFMGSVEAAGQ
ncbi:unnamed protein product [Ostreobium quekettii]|uniref:Serpin domain-containing protein n=1 Tax=Ostreobium quekettii TaxID=121088 RepID=A0A8S1IZ41_9CHLO|nr:unnamed protein product [Ostreobium quekettii]|eukprot:evm.model.scf_285EXC.10 EVM.evm.TU.scf_285EXC.10   scf_285EXC:69097-72366(-)